MPIRLWSRITHNYHADASSVCVEFSHRYMRVCIYESSCNRLGVAGRFFCRVELQTCHQMYSIAWLASTQGNLGAQTRAVVTKNSLEEKEHKSRGRLLREKWLCAWKCASACVKICETLCENINACAFLIEFQKCPTYYAQNLEWLGLSMRDIFCIIYRNYTCN